jgi:DnaJ-class molecular chaperone
VLIAVGAVLYLSLKKEPQVRSTAHRAQVVIASDAYLCVTQVCDLCSGTGGIKCFACDGNGKMLSVPLDAVTAQQRRNPLGVSSNPRQCRACTGSGLLLCRKCKGAGFVT